VKRSDFVRRALVAAALVTAAALYAWVVAHHLREIARGREGLDFHDYFFSARAVVDQGKSIYDYRAMNALSHRELGTKGLPVFVYPPLLVVLFLPLAKLSYPVARIGWIFFNHLCLGATTLGCVRLYEARGGRRVGTPFWIVFTLFAASLYEPMLNHDWQGQSNLLVSALTAWALVAALRDERSDLATGLFLAPAILLKLFPGIFIPYLVIRRRWRALAWTAVVGAAITLATLVWIPISDYLRFPHVLLDSMYLHEDADTLGNYSMAATVAIAFAVLGLGPAAVKVGGALLKYLPYPLALAASALEFRREASLVGKARLVTALRLTQPFILMGFLISKWWDHHLVFLLVPYFFAIRIAFLEGLRARAVAALVVISGLWIALTEHPLLWDVLHGRRWDWLRGGLYSGKRFAILMLLVATELLIRALDPRPLFVGIFGWPFVASGQPPPDKVEV
jgi:Glycosyltransferase family 87